MFGISSIQSITGWLKTLDFQGRGVYDSQNDYGPTTSTIILFLFVILCSVVISVVYLICLRAFTKQTLWLTSTINMCVGLGGAIYCFAIGGNLSGAGHLVLGTFYTCCFLGWKTRLPYSITMVEKTMDISKKFGHTLKISATGGAIAVGFTMWFATTLVAVCISYTPDPRNPACENTNGQSCSMTNLFWRLNHAMFGGYWISEVIKNSIHVLVSSGKLSNFLFSFHIARRMGEMPTQSALLAGKRAIWYSFGSIVYGSLASSIVQLLHQASSICRENDRPGRFSRITCFSITFQSCIGANVIDSESEKHYGYSRMAFESLDYTTSVKNTLRMLTENEIDTLINNNLVDPVLTAGAVFSGYLCASFSYLYLTGTDPTYNKNGNFTFPVVTVSFWIGLQIFNISLVSVKSGVTTIFVSMATHPDILRRNHRLFYLEMVGAYAKVSEVSSLQ
ncbi:unnamed protein product, partial [Tuber aestivum]